MRAQLSQRKGVMPNVLCSTDIYGVEVYNRMQELLSCASVNPCCSFVADRSHQIGVFAVSGMTPISVHCTFGVMTSAEQY